MPSRIWSDELGKWVLVEEEGSKLAVNTQVFDVAGHYHDLENEGDKIVNVEECLEEIGNKLNSGDIGAIGEIKEQVNNLDERVTYIEENGGGGGGSAMPVVELLSDSYYAIATDGEIDIYYKFSSPNKGFGTVYVSIDMETVLEDSVSQGRNSYKVKNLEKGEHRLDIYVTDITGLFSNTITVTIVVGGLELTSNFDASNDISLEDYIRIRYNITTIHNAPNHRNVISPFHSL